MTTVTSLRNLAMRKLIPLLLNLTPPLIPMLIGIWLSTFYLVATPPVYDSEEYFAMAYNMAKYGVSSKSTEDSPLVLPDMFREPGTSFALSLPLRSMDLDQQRLSCFLSKDMPCAEPLKKVEGVNVIMVALIVLGVYLAALQLTGSRGWSFVAASVVATNTILPSYVRVLTSEMPGALFFLWHSLMLYGAFSGRYRRACAIAAGVFLAALVLTKAVYFYWLLCLWIGAAMVPLVMDKPRARRILTTMVLVLVPATAGVGAWMTRNNLLFDSFSVSDRSGIVLAMRAGYTRISWEQYFSGYLYFTPYVGTDLAQRFSGDLASKTYDDNVLDWWHHLDFVSGVSKNEGSMEEQYRHAAFRLMLKNWDKQLALIPLTAYRGMFIGGCCNALANDIPPYWGLPSFNKFVWPVQALATALLGPVVLLLAIMMAIRRNWKFFVFCSPVLFHFLIYSVATHFLPRYSIPVYPSLVVMMALFMCIAFSRARRSLIDRWSNSAPAARSSA